MLQALQDEYQPETATEIIMVERVAMLFQKMKRLQRIENTLFEVAKNEVIHSDKIFKAAGVSEKNMLAAIKEIQNLKTVVGDVVKIRLENLS